MPRRAQPQPPRQPVGVPTQVRLDPAQRAALQLIAEQDAVAVSAVIRRAIDTYLDAFEGSDGRTLLDAARRGDLDDFGPVDR